MIRAIRDSLTVGRPPRSAVISGRVRQPSHLGSIRVHRVDLEIAILERSEHNLLSVRREHSLRSVDVVVCQSAEIATVAMHHVLLIAWVAVAGALKREPPAVGTEIRLRILAAECDLANCTEVPFAKRRT